MSTELSCGWLRIVLWVLVPFGATGCASTTTAVPEQGVQWRQVARVSGCVSPNSQWDLADQISIRLQPELQAALMDQLEQQPIEDPHCWYQISGGDLLLRAGSFCGLSKEAQFHHDGLQWSLVRVEDILGQCGTKL